MAKSSPLQRRIEGSRREADRIKDFLEPGADGSYPSLSSFDPESTSDYDLIVCSLIAVPLLESPSGGTVLDADVKKPAGTDFPSVTGRGYDSEPVRFSILLFYDTRTGTDWMKLYEERVRDVLLPRPLERRNAIDVYHPLLAGDGILSMVIKRRSTPRHVGAQKFVVEVEAIDVRTIGKIGGSKTKKMVNDTKLKSNGTVLGKSGSDPVDREKGRK